MRITAEWLFQQQLSMNKKRRLCQPPLSNRPLRKGSPISLLAATSDQNCCSPGYQFRSSAATFRLVDALLKCKHAAKLSSTGMIFEHLQAIEINDLASAPIGSAKRVNVYFYINTEFEHLHAVYGHQIAFSSHTYSNYWICLPSSTLAPDDS
jgi:hypothetical protein